jgi:hypothetical protein
MNNLSFDIKSSNDFLQKLVEDHEEFKLNSTSSRIALNCAMTAWHLSEWIYNEYHERLGTEFSSLKDFQAKMKEQCPSLQIMHDLANGTKHFKLNRHKSTIESTKLHQGDFNSDFSRDFDISSLDIILNNGTKVYFEDEINACLNYWIKYLNNII